MTKIVDRNYLEIKSIDALIESKSPHLNHSIDLVKNFDFQINNFLQNVKKYDGLTVLLD